MSSSVIGVPSSTSWSHLSYKQIPILRWVGKYRGDQWNRNGRDLPVTKFLTDTLSLHRQKQLHWLPLVRWYFY